ncbi:hypothetical protein D3C76_1563200 [compost metagenome]
MRLAWRFVLGLCRGGLAGQQLRGHLQAAVTPQRQFGAALQVHRHRACGTGLQLLAREQTIAFDQGTAATVAANGKNLTNHLADHTDQLRHDTRLP